MRCALVLTALAATLSIGSCQAQIQFLHRRQEQGDGPQSNSFFSQTSWSLGQDGEFHKQTQTSSTESKEDGSLMKKRTVCKDGHCTEVIEVLAPLESPPVPPCPFEEEVQWSPQDDAGFNPQGVFEWGPQGPIPLGIGESPQEGPILFVIDMIPDGAADAGFNPQEGHMLPPPTYAEMHAPQPYPEMQPTAPQPQPALRGMLNRLIENMQHHQQQQQLQQQQQQQQPTLIMEPMRNMQPPSRLRAILDQLYGNVQRQRPQEPREIMIDTRGDGAEIILERLPQGRWFDSPHESMIEIEIPQPPPQYRAPVKASSKMTFVKVGVAIVALGAAYALVMAALNCYRVDQVSARERPLREFAEPLAPDSVNVMIPGAATYKADPVRMYLSSLYTRANTKNEARGVTTYLARLYARILA